MTLGLTAQLGTLHLLPDAVSKILSSGSELVSDALPMSSPVLASGGVEIDLDFTFLIQMVIFVVLAIVLKPVLYDPVLRVFALREEKTDGAKAEARTLQTRAGELLQRYEKEFERVHQVAGRERDRWRAETTKLESAVIDEARQNAASILGEGRAQIQESVNAVRFQLGRESERVAEELADRVLGRKVNE